MSGKNGDVWKSEFSFPRLEGEKFSFWQDAEKEEGIPSDYALQGTSGNWTERDIIYVGAGVEKMIGVCLPPFLVLHVLETSCGTPSDTEQSRKYDRVLAELMYCREHPEHASELVKTLFC